jgi:metal-responsive CopG/Arc/MetJ family transcriptional regulator
MRITINLGKELVNKIDSEAKEKGLSRSQLIAQKLVQKLNESDSLESKKELDYTKRLLELSKNRTIDLQTQLGFLQQQYSLITQRMLESPEKIKKRRWKFWKH